MEYRVQTKNIDKNYFFITKHRIATYNFILRKGEYNYYLSS